MTKQNCFPRFLLNWIFYFDDARNVGHVQNFVGVPLWVFLIVLLLVGFTKIVIISIHYRNNSGRHLTRRSKYLRKIQSYSNYSVGIHLYFFPWVHFLQNIFISYFKSDRPWNVVVSNRIIGETCFRGGIYSSAHTEHS